MLALFRRHVGILLIALLAAMIGGCRSGERGRTARSDEPIPRAESNEPLNGDQAENMAADDVEGQNLPPARREPSRRPPPVPPPRAVDQPRIGR